MPAQLTYLKIHEFRRVKPGSVIEFKPGFNVVVGPNGAGKTTLLNLISAILRHNFHQFVEEPVSIEYQLRNGDHVLDCVFENRVADNNSTFTLSGRLTGPGGALEFDSTEVSSNFTIVGEQSPSTSGTSVVPRKSLPDRLGDAFLAVEVASPSGWAMSTTDVHISTPVRSTEGSERFNELFTPEAHQFPPGLGFVGMSDTILGYGLRPDVLSPKQVGELKVADNIVLTRNIEPLAQFLELTQYSNASLNLVKTHSNAKGPVFGRPFGRFEISGGDEIPHEQLSFGEKRLLAFLLELYAHPSTVIVDELANGMHHSWIERCVELLEDLGTQAFLTSQNPLLLDCLPLDRDSYAHTHTLVICELAESHEMVWRNLTPHESEDFFRTLEVGLQHISAIMRTKGLW